MFVSRRCLDAGIWRCQTGGYTAKKNHPLQTAKYCVIKRNLLWHQTTVCQWSKYKISGNSTKNQATTNLKKVKGCLKHLNVRPNKTFSASLHQGFHQEVELLCKVTVSYFSLVFVMPDKSFSSTILH